MVVDLEYGAETWNSRHLTWNSGCIPFAILSWTMIFHVLMYSILLFHVLFHIRIPFSFGRTHDSWKNTRFCAMGRGGGVHVAVEATIA